MTDNTITAGVRTAELDCLKNAIERAMAVVEAACAAYPDMEPIQTVCGDLLMKQLNLASAAVTHLDVEEYVQRGAGLRRAK